jgi:hypothetical protein
MVFWIEVTDRGEVGGDEVGGEGEGGGGAEGDVGDDEVRDPPDVGFLLKLTAALLRSPSSAHLSIMCVMQGISYVECVG